MMAPIELQATTQVSEEEQNGIGTIISQLSFIGDSVCQALNVYDCDLECQWVSNLNVHYANAGLK